MIVDALNYTDKIPLGKQGENLAKTITFDCKDWLGDMTGGALSLVAQRPTDEDGYPVPATTTEDTLTWTVNSTDVAFEGIGYAELRYTVGEQIIKSQTFLTEIKKGLTPNDTPPEAYVPYINAVEEASKGNSAVFIVDVESDFSIEVSTAKEIVNALKEGKSVMVYFIYSTMSGYVRGEASSSILYSTSTHSGGAFTYDVTISFQEYDASFYINESSRHMVDIERKPKSAIEIEGNDYDDENEFYLDVDEDEMERYVYGGITVQLKLTSVNDITHKIILPAPFCTIKHGSGEGDYALYYKAVVSNQIGTIKVTNEDGDIIGRFTPDGGNA